MDISRRILVQYSISMHFNGQCARRTALARVCMVDAQAVFSRSQSHSPRLKSGQSGGRLQHTALQALHGRPTNRTRKFKSITCRTSER